jgi:hypothetical protein
MSPIRYVQPEIDVSWARVPVLAERFQLYLRADGPGDNTSSLRNADGELHVFVPPVLSAPNVTGIARAVSTGGWEIWLRFDGHIQQQLNDFAARVPEARLVAFLGRESFGDFTADAVIADGEVGVIGLPTDHHARAAIRAIHAPAMGEQGAAGQPLGLSTLL